MSMGSRTSSGTLRMENMRRRRSRTMMGACSTNHYVCFHTKNTRPDEGAVEMRCMCNVAFTFIS